MNRDVFHAIADPTRRDILMSLNLETQNVNSLAEKFAMTRQAISQHIKVLEECGVILVRQVGRERRCEIEAKTLAQAADWLEPFRKVWETRLDQLDELLRDLQTNQQIEKPNNSTP